MRIEDVVEICRIRQEYNLSCRDCIYKDYECVKVSRKHCVNRPSDFDIETFLEERKNKAKEERKRKK